jgi:uncharacterized membrane protein YqjE
MLNVRSRNLLGFAKIAGVSLGLTLILLIFLPVPLLFLSQLDVDWDRLSAIGQSYTAGATLLSGAALIGIVWSLRLQIRQTSILHDQAVRQFQNDLLEYAMSDPLYASVIPANLDSASEDQFRRHVFTTRWLRYYEFLYLSNEMPVTSMEVELSEFFAVPDNRTWWQMGRHRWFSKVAPISTRRREFVELVEREYIRAAESAAQD